MLWLVPLLLALGILMYAFAVEPVRMRLTRRVLYYPDLPPGLEGLRILHMSDLHFKRHNSRHEVAFLASLAQQSWDLAAITGDLLDSLAGLPQALEALGNFRSRKGVYAILGNHDYADFSLWDFLRFRDVGSQRHSVSGLVQGLEDRGIKVLDNESVCWEGDGASIWVVGIGDVYTDHHDPGKALAGVPEEGFRIVLTHSPELARGLADQADLILAGHTHGGQVRLPGLGAPHHHSQLMGRRRPWGLRKLGRAWLHTSAGLGTTVFPVRFLAPPEATILELRKGSLG